MEAATQGSGSKALDVEFISVTYNNADSQSIACVRLCYASVPANPSALAHGPLGRRQIP